MSTFPFISVCVLIVLNITACTVSEKLSRENIDLIWAPDSIFYDCALRVDTDSSTYNFAPNEASLVSTQHGTELVGLSSLEETKDSIRILWIKISRLWYDKAVIIYLTDGSELSFDADEWYMEVEDGRILSIVGIQPARYMLGGSPVEETQYKTEIISHVELMRGRSTATKVWPANNRFWFGAEIHVTENGHFGFRLAKDFQFYSDKTNVFAVGIRPAIAGGWHYFLVDCRAFINFAFLRLEGGISYSRYGGFPVTTSEGDGWGQWSWDKHTTYRNERNGPENDLFLLWSLALQLKNVRIAASFHQQISGSLYEDVYKYSYQGSTERIVEEFTQGPLDIRSVVVTVSLPLDLFF